ncbi:Amuc_1101 family PilM-like pilus complex protein [Luteolibacter algae]|uniref:Amuc_1101 family PilM-like pilus complex protein n=1 Tax=Luteolibacter algae TaxID=454151 RepID=A0ABW5DE43_9BACT
MADSQTTVALNIGSQRIGLAVFETSKNGKLILKGYESESINADPAFEASRDAQVRVAVDDLVKKLKVSKSKVRYAISGQTVFTRFVKLPPLQDDNIEQLVTFEAQQHVPFPINEVVWDYELIEGEGEKEVVIVAIKADALDEINKSVNDSSLATAEVDVAPMALYNAFRATYGAPEESTLIIDVGAKTSNLLYVEGNRFFTRSIAIGGASVTAAIAKEYNISFADAEHQKVTNGLVALGGGHTENLDESVAALAMVIRNALTRLPSEIARTTNYYRSQHGGSAPRKVLLAGGGANLPYTLEFFTEKLNLPVEFFNPLGQVTIGKNVDTELLQREAHTMGELIGLGLRGSGKSTINIDLVPEAVEVSRAADRRKPFLIGAAVLLVSGFAAWAAFQNVAASKAEDRRRTMAETEESLAPFETEIRGLLKKEEALNNVANSYTNIEADHAYWFNLLSELRGAFASDSVWITNMEPVYSYETFSGKSPKTVVKPVVNADFASEQAGNKGSIAQPAKVENNQGGGRRNNRNQPQAAPVGSATAILVKGFWRENAQSQGVVSNLLKKLRGNSEVFNFQTKDDKGKEVTLSDEQLLKISSVGQDGDLGFPFELILPLARPVSVK